MDNETLNENSDTKKFTDSGQYLGSFGGQVKKEESKPAAKAVDGPPLTKAITGPEETK